MLYFIVVWTGLLGTCLIIGCGYLHRLNASILARPAERFILAAWLGLSVLAILMLAAALFVPLSPLTGLGVALLAIAPALTSQSARSELAHWWRQGFSKWRLAGYGLCSSLIAAFMTQAIDWIDTGAYHYGLIQWFSEYGTTPGLALLNRQFGFISAWFALAAPFNPTSVEGRASTVMNGFILLLAIIQMAIALKCIAPQSPKKLNALNSWFLLTFSLIVCLFLTQTPFLSRVTVSASPDVAIALFSVAVSWSMLIIDTAKREHSFYAQAPQSYSTSNIDFIPVVLAAAAFSIKLTALPLLPIALGFYLFRSFSILHWTKGILLTLTLILPFLITQTIISGYPLYPSTALQFSLPWTRTLADVQDLANNTHGWAHWFGQPPVGENRFLWLLWRWFNGMNTSKIISVLIVGSLGSSAYLLSRPKTRNHYGFIWLMLLSAVGITFTMLKAPLFRFGMGYALLLPMLSTAMIGNSIYNRIYSRFSKRPLNPLLTQKLRKPLAIALLTCTAIAVWLPDPSARSRLIFAAPLPKAPLQQQQINGIAYTITQDPQKQCWSAQLPCISDMPSQVQLRNPSVGIKGGFIYGSLPNRS